MPENIDKKEFVSKYRQKLKQELGESIDSLHLSKQTFSREYKLFKKEYLPKRLNLYERICNLSEKLFKIPPSKKKLSKYEEAIKISHLEITPKGAVSFAYLAVLVWIIVGSLIGYMLPFLFTGEASLFFVGFFILSGIAIISPLMNLPFYFANSWRLKTSNQMVLCVFYIVTYMRHTSNLELAINFAADHISPPLALDLKKVVWDVETEKFESVKESLDHYLESWRKWNLEFIESFHLIESSLYEPTEERRLSLLEKSLDVILEETYEKMLHYAHNLQTPITMLHMLGIILPILGLVILPLIVSFMSGVQWYHIGLLYVVVFPAMVYFVGTHILSQRPTGYGETDVSEKNPELKKKKNFILKLGNAELIINPLTISLFILVISITVGLSPILLNWTGFEDIGFGSQDKLSACGKSVCLLDYRPVIKDGVELDRKQGPFGLGAAILSLFFVFGTGLSIGLYYKIRSQKIIKIRKETKNLENEFASTLFQLGNRLGDGLPAEIAFDKVAEIMKDSLPGKFCSLVNTNIRRLGMSVNEAIFNPKTGAILFFPSNLIDSSMRILIESIKKGPAVAAQALVNISRYLKEIHRVNERLKDLMADIISSMKSQIKFMAPVISGIVIGITSMVGTIIGKLSRMLGNLEAGSDLGGAGNIISQMGDGIPTFYFQIIVGLYVIEIVYILTILSNSIENGVDKVNEQYELGKNLIYSTTLYCGVALIVMIIFNLVAVQIMEQVGLGI